MSDTDTPADHPGDDLPLVPPEAIAPEAPAVPAPVSIIDQIRGIELTLAQEDAAGAQTEARLKARNLLIQAAGWLE